MSATQRKAWNEAMRNAAGGTLPIPGLAPTIDRRSSRSSNKRREKARRAISLNESSTDAVAYRLDVLEEVGNLDEELGDGDEDFDELDDVDGSNGGSGVNGRSRGRKRKVRGGGGSGGKKKAVIEKRFKARSLASILMEESGRGDGIVREYVDAEARCVSSNNRDGNGHCVGSVPSYPRRKFCPVTGLEGKYTDPKSGIPYANLEALEQLRERVPPWLNSFSGGSAAYHDTIKSIRNDE